MAGPKLLNRLGTGLGKTVAVLFQFLVVGVMLVFWAGSCTKDGRNFLSCIGIIKPSTEKKVEFRALDPKNEKDKRLVLALVKIAKVASMDLNKIRVGIAVDQHINAMTVGTDTFVFCEGLDKLPEESLNAVMAHEVAHAIKNHSGRSSKLVGTIGKITNVTGAILGQDEETREEVTSWAVNVAFAPYSRGQELEADSFGVELLKKAGYPMNAVDVMCGALDSISKQESDTGGGFLSTHPAIPDRIKALRENSGNVTGPLTKEQYWAAMDTILKDSAAHQNVNKTLEEQVKTLGEKAALSERAAQDEKSLTWAQVFIDKATAIKPPPEYSQMHGKFISFFKQLQTALKHNLDSAKEHNLKGTLSADEEARQVMDRNAEFMKQYDAESKKYSPD